MAIKFVLFESGLQNLAGSHTARVRPTFTADLESIADRISRRGTTVAKSGVMSVLEDYHAVIEELLLDGAFVNTPHISYRTSVKGRFGGVLDGFDPAQHRLAIRVITGKRLRRLLKNYGEVIKLESNDVLPHPAEFFDANSSQKNSVLAPGGLGELGGYRIQFNHADAEQGVFFIDAAKNETRVTVVSRIKPSEITFLIPTLAPGEYTLQVRTAMNGTPQQDLHHFSIDPQPTPMYDEIMLCQGRQARPAFLPLGRSRMKTVTSKDGTIIAFDQLGQGPPLILVEGAFGQRAMPSPISQLAGLLAQHFTVLHYDRRGRGESTDTQPYAVAREVEDIEALVDEIGGTAFLFGVSSGAALALEAAIALDGKIRKLALYDAAYNSNPADRPAWAEYRKQLRDALAAGRRGDAVALFMSFVGMPADQIDGMRQNPLWPMWEMAAPTLVYDANVLGEEDRSAPIERAARIAVPTLIINGTESPPFMHVTAIELANAISKAQRRTLKGQGHAVAAEAIAPLLVDFFTFGREAGGLSSSQANRYGET